MNILNVLIIGILGALPTGPALLGLYEEAAQRARLPKRMILSFLLADLSFLILAFCVYQQGQWIEDYKTGIYFCSALFLLYSGARLLWSKKLSSYKAQTSTKTFLSVILNPSIFLFYLGVFFLLTNKEQAALLFITTTVSLIVFLKIISTYALDIKSHLQKIHLIAGIVFSLLGIHFLTKVF